MILVFCVQVSYQTAHMMRLNGCQKLQPHHCLYLVHVQLITGRSVAFHFSSVYDTNCLAFVYRMKTPEAESGLFLIIRFIKTDLARFLISLVCLVWMSAETDLIQNRALSACESCWKTS